jgi:hypothetical protein
VRRGSLPRLLLGVLLFAAGFAVANRFQLTHAVLYRAAAHDLTNAALNFLYLAAQAAVLLAAIILLSRRLFIVAMLLAGLSILINLGYGQTLNDQLDAGKLSWMLAETRQARSAFGEFMWPLLFAALQAAVAIALFVTARGVIGGSGWAPLRAVRPVVGIALLAGPTLLAAPLDLSPASAERNMYGLAMQIALAEPPPPRDPVRFEPVTQGTPRHIVWLIDESVAYAPFNALIRPGLAGLDPVDFGMTASLGNCSAPANVALRSGVDVRAAGPDMDLRRTPSIWGYARKAGYHTILIDGQTKGVPQNLLLPPERALIDEMRLAAGGIDTDVGIADALNRQFRSGRRSFTYVVLQGVHFQYQDHYPAGLIPPDSPTIRHYETALRYSKGRFFERLLKGVDREQVAIVYTSDHGQNLAEGALPHCSPTPGPNEFRVPLLAFLPRSLAARYAGAARSGHSASQIFPATLGWMGYDGETVRRHYDNDLTAAPAAYVWFGRNVIPVHSGDKVGVVVGKGFPGLAGD